MNNLPNHKLVYLSEDSSMDESIELTEADKHLITELLSSFKPSNKKVPTYEEIKRQLIISPGDFKLKKETRKQIIEALAQEFFQTTEPVTEYEIQIWTSPATSVTNPWEDGKEMMADEIENVICFNDKHNSSTIPSSRRNFEEIEIPVTENVSTNILDGSTNITNKNIEGIIKSTEQTIGVDVEESIECYQIFKSAPKAVKSFEMVNEIPESIDLTCLEDALDEDKHGQTHEKEDELKHIQLETGQESKRNVEVIDVEKLQTNGDELLFDKMIEPSVCSKEVLKPEYIKDKKPSCAVHGKKTMYDEESPFFIDRDLVSVDVYQDGLQCCKWNPTQVLYEICSLCQWTTPEFSKISFSLKEGFLFSVQVNNDIFQGESKRTIKAAKHSASTTLLQFLGFDFEPRSTPDIDLYPAPARIYKPTRNRKWEDGHCHRDHLNIRAYKYRNHQSWRNHHRSHYYNKNRNPAIISSPHL